MTTDFVNPLVHEGELTIEASLPGNMSVSVGYVFSRGLHLPVFVDANLAPATTTHTYAVLHPAAVVHQDHGALLHERLNPQTGVILTGYSVSNSWYNARSVASHADDARRWKPLFNYT